MSITMQREFREKGYVILKHAVCPAAAVKEMRVHFPPDAEEPVQDFGSGNGAVFPSTPALNDITVHPALLEAVRAILGFDIRLKQSVPWAKYGVPSSGTGSNSDQRVHMDYGNNQWDMPQPGEPVAVAALVYYSDTAETGGATAVVPRQGLNDPVYSWPYTHMPGIGGNPFVNQKKEAEASMSGDSAALRDECYAREIVPHFEPGDVLLYGLDTWHRGTPVHRGQVRYAHNLLWAKEGADIQQWNPGFTSAMYSGKFERFVSQLEPAQLQTLGFPKPGDPRWDSAKFVEAMRARYAWSGLDVMRYVHSARKPPPAVPEYWLWSSLRLETSGDPFTFRDTLWHIFAQLGLYVEMQDARWKYTVETVSPYYVQAECRFFASGSTTSVDIHLVDGDRLSWVTMARNIRAMVTPTSVGTSLQSLTRTPALSRTASHLDSAVVEALVSPCMDARLFDLVGSGVNPDVLLASLPGAPMNTRRLLLRALYHCTASFDVRRVEPYVRARPRNFLEGRAHDWANRILKKGKYVAHL